MFDLQAGTPSDDPDWVSLVDLTGASASGVFYARRTGFNPVGLKVSVLVQDASRRQVPFPTNFEASTQVIELTTTLRSGASIVYADEEEDLDRIEATVLSKRLAPGIPIAFRISKIKHVPSAGPSLRYLTFLARTF